MVWARWLGSPASPSAWWTWHCAWHSWTCCARACWHLGKGWQKLGVAQQCWEAVCFHWYLKMVEVLWRNLYIIKKKRERFICLGCLLNTITRTCVFPCECRYRQRPEKGTRFPWIWSCRLWWTSQGPGSCLLKSVIHSGPLSHLSRTTYFLTTDT